VLGTFSGCGWVRLFVCKQLPRLAQLSVLHGMVKQEENLCFGLSSE